MLAILLATQVVSAAPAPAAEHNAKPKQECTYRAVTGSRAKQRICKDATGHEEAIPGVFSSAVNSGRFVPGQSGSGIPAGGGVPPQ